MDIVLAEEDEIVTQEKELVGIFSDCCINIIGCFCGTKPTNVAKEKEIEDKKAIGVILKSFANHASIKAVKEITLKKISQL